MKIAFISQPEYFRFIYENDIDDLAEVKEFNFNFTKNKFSDLEEFNADVNIFFRGEYFPNSTLERLKGIKVNISSEIFPKIINNEINYSFDSLQRYENFRNLITHKQFDYVFHYDKHSVSFMKDDGINLSGAFGLPVATSIYRKNNLPKRWDFFFIGRSTYHRERFFSSLKHYYEFLHICHGIYGQDLVTYMNQSKILLNIHAEQEISWEPRVQMLMATGGMVISEDIGDNPYFIPGKDFVTVSEPGELLEKSKYYLEHEAERELIALNGMNKVHKYLNSRQVFANFIENLQNEAYQKFSCNPKFKLNLEVMLNELENKQNINDVEVLKENLQQMRNKVRWMESSKFWQARKMVLSLKKTMFK
ncbi:hypothetical protein B6N60_00180 [Richelia sinica FACHB-800]|uniref:Spore protein YkvP/CgeB glycosyl transferase-like domain-containing protein n=1 Tax=Richelia sinica FACHB-800 TaxID=1357546 RepID=A0A975T3R6_9NOST|nr:glycosyltransferase [Richelia sinica]MBD2666508.1 glycosyltransferase family 1 protein [Richelia sinica FACHB-800]QXE21504.1 hypothetical protein B6N60_00180 [Richelia sinica FACHB-800]